MKPNADMITKILHNFRVNGKFDQDQLIIGRGVDEQLQLMIQEGSEGVATLTFDNKTFYRRPDLDKYLVDGCTLAYGDTLTGNPTATLYRGSETWCGENWFDPEMQIGNDTPTWEATGGTADSPEGTTWGSIYDSEKTLVSTYTVTGGSDPIGIRYTPSVAGERTFTILGTTDHPVFDETVTLYPYEKPVNDFTNSWVLAEEDVIWISDKFTDPDFPDVRYIMYIGGAGGPMPNQWRVHTIGSSDDGVYGVDWTGTNTPDFLGAQENVTWSNGEASAYPETVDDWSTSGYQGVQPESFSMSNTEGSDAKLEYTNDGTTWYPFGGSGSAGITYEPIEFTGDDLQDDGTIHIQHDFNNKNVLCLGCTPQPKEITYLDNEIVLDYSDQNSSNLVGAVWFVNSKQEMLVVPVAPEPRNVPENLTSNTSDKNWSIMKTSVNPSNPNEGIESDDPEMFQMFDNDVSTGCTFSGSAGSLYRWNRSDLTPIKPEKLYVKQGDFLDLGAVADGMMLFVYASNTKVTSPYETGSLTEIANHMGGAAGTYEIDLSSNSQSYIYWYVMMVNAESGTIYEISEDPLGGGVIDPEEPSGQVKVSGAGISDAEGIYTLTSGSASEPLEYTKEGTGWIITRTMGYDPTHTHVNWSIRNTNTNAYAYASESFGGTEVKYPWELTWTIDPDGVEPVPTVEQYITPSVLLPDPSIRISNCGVEEANGDYSIIPEQYWDQYVDPTYLQNHTVVQLWTNGTGVLETNGAEPYIYPVGSDPSKVDPWYAGVVSTDPNDPLTVSVWITLDNGIAPVPTLEAI